MTEILPVLGDVGPGAILVLVVLLILTGRLVPGKERDYWRAAFFEEQRQKRELLVAAQVTRDVMQALPDPGKTPPR